MHVGCSCTNVKELSIITAYITAIIDQAVMANQFVQLTACVAQDLCIEPGTAAEKQWHALKEASPLPSCVCHICQHQGPARHTEAGHQAGSPG
jgi:hypothetical protein